MQVGTGRSILNGIAIGKLKIYKKKDTALRLLSRKPLSSRLLCTKRHWPKQARTLPKCSTSTP